MLYLTNGLDNGISLPNGIKRIYEGDWVEDQREGQGYEKYSNLNEYEGGFKQNKAHGRGIYAWRTSGDFYEGQWIMGERSGKGAWRSGKGEYYEGDWVTNQAHGYGVMIWANGKNTLCFKNHLGDRY